MIKNLENFGICHNQVVYIEKFGESADYMLIILFHVIDHSISAECIDEA